MLVMVINLSKNVQVNCSLLELCRRHAAMPQVKVLQVPHIQQLVDNVLEGFTVHRFAPPCTALHGGEVVLPPKKSGEGREEWCCKREEGGGVLQRKGREEGWCGKG